MNEQTGSQRPLCQAKARPATALFSVLAMLLILLFVGASAQAEGSKDLVRNGGYRPYIEWYISKSYYSGKSAS